MKTSASWSSSLTAWPSRQPGAAGDTREGLAGEGEIGAAGKVKVLMGSAAWGRAELPSTLRPPQQSDLGRTGEMRGGDAIC